MTYRVRLKNQRDELIAESEQDAPNRTEAGLRALRQASYTDTREVGWPIWIGAETSHHFIGKNPRRRLMTVTARITELLIEEQRQARVQAQADAYFARHGRMP